MSSDNNNAEDSRIVLGRKIFAAVINRCGAYGMYAFHTLDAPRSRRYVELRVESKFDSVLDTNYECASMNDDELASLLEFVQDDRTHPQLIRKLPMC